MSIELRDFFAAHVAAALATRATEASEAEAIASRAYDLAEALLRERSFRDEPVSMGDRVMVEEVDRDADEPEAWAAYASDFEAPGLLDEPAPWSESDNEVDPSWYDREIDPRWETGDRWAPPGRETPEAERPSDRPGVRSTRPSDPSTEKRHRSA